MKFPVILCLSLVGGCLNFHGSYAQTTQEERTKERIAIVNDLVADLYKGEANAYIFQKYLASNGKFQDSTIRKMANNLTTGIKEGLAYVPKEDMRVYHYPSSPEIVRRVKAIDDQDPSESKYGPLRFNLETSRPNARVELEDLFRIESRDKQFISYVLFNKQNRVISFTGIMLGDKVTLFEF